MSRCQANRTRFGSWRTPLAITSLACTITTHGCARSYTVELVNSWNQPVYVRIVEEQGERQVLAEDTIEPGAYLALGPVESTITESIRLEAQPASDKMLPATRLRLSPGLTEIQIRAAEESDWRTLRFEILRLGGYLPGEPNRSPDDVYWGGPK